MITLSDIEFETDRPRRSLRGYFQQARKRALIKIADHWVYMATGGPRLDECETYCVSIVPANIPLDTVLSHAWGKIENGEIKMNPTAWNWYLSAPGYKSRRYSQIDVLAVECILHDLQTCVSAENV